jgi:glycerol kinase
LFQLFQVYLLLIGEGMQKGKKRRIDHMCTDTVNRIGLMRTCLFGRVMIGLSGSTTKAHICRSVLDAVCFQSDAVLRAMAVSAGSAHQSLRVDGGMTKSDLLLQIQADISGLPVERLGNPETTALGAAIVAGITVGLYSPERLVTLPTNPNATVFSPKITAEERASLLRDWECAIQSSLAFAK